MALTESRVRQIVREETARALREGDYEGREDARDPHEKERMDRASEMGGDEDEEEMGAGDVKILAREMAGMYIRAITQYDDFDAATEEFWNQSLREVDWRELTFAMEGKCRREGWGKEYLRPSVVEAAVNIVAEKILNMKRRQRGGSGYRHRY